MSESSDPTDSPPSVPRRGRLAPWLVVVCGAAVAIVASGYVLILAARPDWLGVVVHGPKQSPGALRSRELEAGVADRMPLVNRFLAALDEGRDEEACELTSATYGNRIEAIQERAGRVRELMGRCRQRELRDVQRRSLGASPRGSQADWSGITLTFGAQFEKGDGKIVVELETRGGEWTVREWNVYSAALNEAESRDEGK